MKRLILVGIAFAVSFALGSAAVAEEDHLLGYKVKSLDRLKPQTNHVVTNQFGTDDCELKGKAKFFLVQSEKDGVDDPRGGPAGEFACYKAKCSGSIPPDTHVYHQLGDETYEAKKVQILCVPVDTYACGDGDVDPGEQCDGSDDVACPGLCLPDCTCTPQTCGNSIREGTEECDGADDSACPGNCLSDCTCPPPACGNGIREGAEECDGRDDDACPGDCLLNCTCAFCQQNQAACKIFGSSSSCYACCKSNNDCVSPCAAASKSSCLDPDLNTQCALGANAVGCAVECCIAF